MLFNWKLKILSSIVAVAMLFTVCPSTTFATKTWLHELLADEKHAPSVEEVERIVKKHPEWLSEEDNDGCTPVKIAGDKGLSEIATFLSGFVPPSSGPDYYAKRMAAIIDNTTTWLHEVLEDEDVSLEEIKHIVDKHEEWLSEKDYPGQHTPYDIAKEKELREDILLILTEPPMLSPSALSKKMTALKTQMEELQKCSKILQEKVDRLQKQMADLTTQAVAITGGTIDSAAITGGTVSGLTTPLAVADGGTGLNALGTAGQLLTVNKTADALAWHTFDCLDISSLGISLTDSTDFNTITTPGTYMMNGPQNSANKPPSITANSVRITVKQINENNILQTVETAVSNQHFVRVYRISANTWSDWNPQTNVGFCIGLSSGTLTGVADSSYHKVALDTLFFNTAGGTFASNGYKLPYTGNWLFILKCNWWSNIVSTKYCEIAKGSSLTQLEFGLQYFATTSQDATTTTVTALASCNKDDEIYMAANNMTTSGGIRIIEGTRLQGIYLGV